jgi:hypothetical protein
MTGSAISGGAGPNEIFIKFSTVSAGAVSFGQGGQQIDAAGEPLTTVMLCNSEGVPGAPGLVW